VGTGSRKERGGNKIKRRCGEGVSEEFLKNGEKKKKFGESFEGKKEVRARLLGIK